MSESKVRLLPLVLSLSMLAGYTTHALADPTAGPSGELIVSGTYKPTACSVILASNGTIDYGRIQSSSLSSNDFTTLATKTLANAITVNCPTETNVAISWEDNRATTSNIKDSNDITARDALLPSKEGTGVGLGLGDDGKGHKIGNYVAELNNVKVNGYPALLTDYMESFANGAGKSGFQYSPNPGGALVSNIVNNLGLPYVGSVFTMDFSVNTQIAPTSDLDLSKEITLDGSSTVSLYYL